MKTVKRMSKLLSLPLLAIMVIVVAGCGGGGGTPSVSFPSTTATVTGTIASMSVDSNNLARVAGRTAAQATTITDFSGFTVTAAGISGTITGNTYRVEGVPAGTNILVRITKGAIILKAYVPATNAGKSHTKNVSLTTTAAAHVWEQMGRPSDTSVESLEDNTNVATLATTLAEVVADNTKLGDADNILEASSVETQVDTTLQAGDETAPTISSIYPNEDVTKLGLDTTTITLTFNEAMTTSSVPTGISLVITNVTASASSTVSTPTVTWSSDGKTLSIDHGTTHSSLAEYSVVITLDPTQFSDEAGNAMSALPSSISGASVSTTANTITIEYKATGYYEYEESDQNTLDEIGATATTFITKFSGGTTIAGSGASYVGTEQCKDCHASIYVYYKQTNHYTAYERKLLGYFKSSCIYCHSVDGPVVPDYSAGLDAPDRSDLSNGAFGLAATDYSATAIDAVPDAMRSIQCENCHGPASLHIAGNAGAGDPDLIVSGDDAFAVTTCAVCHDAPTHHEYVGMWREGAHSVANIRASKSCSPCHSGDGFLEFIGQLESDSTAKTYGGNGTVSEPIHPVNCATCHDPHQTNTGAEHQLRLPAEELCLQCHNGRKKIPDGGSHSPHHNVQGRVLAGEAGMTSEGKMYWDTTSEDAPTGFSDVAITPYGSSMGDDITCIDCHMYEGDHGPDHAMKIHVEACQASGCHPTMSDPGSIIGDKQAAMIIALEEAEAILADAAAGLDQDADGDFDSSDLAVEGTTLTQDDLDLYNYAMWNIKYVEDDGSLGFHNTAYCNHLLSEAKKMLAELGYD